MLLDEPWPVRAGCCGMYFFCSFPRFSQCLRGNGKGGTHGAPWGGMRRWRRPLPLPRRHYIALSRSKKNVAASGSRLRLPGLVPRGKSPHGASQQAVLGQWPPPRPARCSTQPPVKDHLNDTPLRPGRGLGAPSPQRERQPTPAPPGTSVPCLHAQCLRPTSTDGQDCTPAWRRRDGSAVPCAVELEAPV
jgi:hypothetical protein